MKLAISVVQGSAPHVWLLDSPPLQVGRDGSNAIQIRHRSVSRQHAEIALRRGHLFLSDLHSHNGTWINGIRVRQPVELHAGDQIQLGRVSLVVSECPSRIAEGNDALSASTFLELPPAHVIGAVARTTFDPGDLIRNLEAFGRRIVSAPTLSAVYDSLLNAVESALPATRTYLLLRADPRAEIDLVAARPRMPCFGEPPIVTMDHLREILDRGNVFLLPDARVAPGTSPRRPTTQVATAMAVPILSEGKPIGLVYAEHSALEEGYHQEHAEILALFANMAAVRIAKSQAVQVADQVNRLRQEIDIAGQIQRWLLPSQEIRLSGWELHGALEPCEAVGGDFYDLHLDSSGDLWIVLGDVAGHGICGAIVMGVLLSAARVLFEACSGPAELTRRLNSVLQGQGGCGRFATIFTAKLDPTFGTLKYVNAGHTYPLLVSGRRLRALESTGPALGVDPGFQYQTEATALKPGDLLAVFTDGIQDARRGRRHFYGERRVNAAIRSAARHASLEEASRSVFKNVDRYLAGAPRSDDIALLLIRRAGSHAA